MSQRNSFGHFHALIVGLMADAFAAVKGDAKRIAVLNAKANDDARRAYESQGDIRNAISRGSNKRGKAKRFARARGHNMTQARR